jgi:hypothetical protein
MPSAEKALVHLDKQKERLKQVKKTEIIVTDTSLIIPATELIVDSGIGTKLFNTAQTDNPTLRSLGIENCKFSFVRKKVGKEIIDSVVLDYPIDGEAIETESFATHADGKRLILPSELTASEEAFLTHLHDQFTNPDAIVKTVETPIVQAQVAIVSISDGKGNFFVKPPPTEDDPAYKYAKDKWDLISTQPEPQPGSDSKTHLETYLKALGEKHGVEINPQLRKLGSARNVGFYPYDRTKPDSQPSHYRDTLRDFFAATITDTDIQNALLQEGFQLVRGNIIEDKPFRRPVLIDTIRAHRAIMRKPDPTGFKEFSQSNNDVLESMLVDKANVTETTVFKKLTLKLDMMRDTIDNYMTLRPRVVTQAA